MNTALRWCSLAMAGAVSCAGSIASEAKARVAKAAEEDEALPGIFAQRRVVAAPVAPPEFLARRSANSAHVAAMITQRVRERAKELDGVAARPVTRRGLGTEAAVLMEKFVVKEKKERRSETEEVVSPMARFWKTGTWMDVGGYQGTLRLMAAPPVGALPKEPVMRVELAIKKKF